MPKKTQKIKIICVSVCAEKKPIINKTTDIEQKKRKARAKQKKKANEKKHSKGEKTAKR